MGGQALASVAGVAHRAAGVHGVREELAVDFVIDCSPRACMCRNSPIEAPVWHFRPNWSSFRSGSSSSSSSSHRALAEMPPSLVSSVAIQSFLSTPSCDRTAELTAIVRPVWARAGRSAGPFATYCSQPYRRYRSRRRKVNSKHGSSQLLHCW